MAMKEKDLMKGSKVLLLVGGLNWGLTHFLGYNLVEKLSFGMGWLETVIYGAVTASALYLAYMYKKFLR